jgi:hypothetical protein
LGRIRCRSKFSSSASFKKKEEIFLPEKITKIEHDKDHEEWQQNGVWTCEHKIFFPRELTPKTLEGVMFLLKLIK